MPKRSICISLSEDLLEELRAVSRERGVSVSGLLERALDRFLILEGSGQAFRGAGNPGESGRCEASRTGARGA